MVFVLVSVWGIAYVQPAEAAPGSQEGKQGGIDVGIGTRLIEKAASDGTVSILVGLDLAVSAGAGQEPAPAVEAIRAAQEPFREYLDAYAIAAYRPYDIIPYIAMRVDRAALEAVLAYPGVSSVEEDLPVPPALASSVPLVGAPAVWASGYDGTGWAVAILDTGVQWNHEFFGGGSSSRVVHEACFSNGGGGGQSLCQNSTHPADPLVSRCISRGTNLCAHGTHVAGIVAGDGPAFSGVAPGASILAVQVFTRFNTAASCGTGNAPCVMAYTSDQILGLQHIYNLRSTYPVAAVNLSLGGGQYDNQAICNGENAAMRSAIQTLRAAGIATVSAAGNDGYTDGLNAPACISEAVGVGVTAGDDTIAAYSNSNEMLDLLAPGVDIYASVPNNAYGTYEGSSMSTAHVSGAWALLKSVNPSANVTDILDVLQTTGVQVSDTRNGLTFSRIRLDAAAALLLPNVWQGDVSNSWREAANWSAGSLPNWKSRVVIPAAPLGGRFPVMDAPDAALQHLTIESGATISMSANTLRVYGDWWVQGTGSFQAAGGTVIMAGNARHAITQTANSDDRFYHLRIGSGHDRPGVALNSALNVDGDFVIEPGSAFSSNGHAVAVAGNWNDLPAAFSPQMSSVILDGEYQVISSTAQSILLDEDFSDFDDTTVNVLHRAYPDGWAVEQVLNAATSLPWLSGRINPDADPPIAPAPAQGGQVRHIWHSSYLSDFDTWLFTPGLDLLGSATYRLEFDYGARSASYAERLAVHYGAGQAAAAMTTMLYQNLAIVNTSWNTGVVTFTVPADGRYTIGFRTYGTEAATWDIALDNIKVTQYRDPTFYDLSVVGSGSQAVLGSNVWVANHLSIYAGAHLDLGAYHLAVDGVVANAGTLTQRKEVAAGSVTEFLHIQNAAATVDQYHGVDITPVGGGMGVTAVSIRGNQAAGCTSNPASVTLRRCFEITPAHAQPATLRLWYTEAERNGLAANSLVLWHYGPGGWTQAGSLLTRSESGSQCASGSGMACWLEATQVSAYSPFALGSGTAPTAVRLASLSASPSPQDRWPAVVQLAGILLCLGWFIWQRRFVFHRVGR